MFVQPTVDFLSHAVSREGLRADAKKLKAITELSFLKTRKGVQAFLGALNYYSRFIQDFAVYGAALYQVREEDFGPGGDLSTAKRSFTALQAKLADAPILRHFDRAKEVHVMLFANEWALSTTLMQEHNGIMHPVRFCGRGLKDNEANYHPAEKEVLALLLLATLSWPGLNIHREIVARFQSVRYLHVTREYNASADSLAGATLAAKEAKTTLTEESMSKLEQLNRIHEVIYERPNREVTQVSTLRTWSRDMVTQRDNFFDFALKPRFITAIPRQQTPAAKKRVRFADTHDEDSEALPVEPEPPDRPNNATTESSHVENGEISPGAAEQPHSAEDIDPLEVQEERRRRVGRAQDEELRWANLKLVLNESSRLGYKAVLEAWKMADRFVLSDDGLLYFLGENRRRFGAPSLVRHDRDPRFVSEVFQAFAEMMQSRSRATLSYRPQANGQQERSVKTVLQSVRVYAEDPLQQDWDEIVERVVFAINNSQDTTRKETPFYRVHGWDAQSTPKAMATFMKRGFGRQSDALVWRREVNRQQEIALKMAKEKGASLPRPRVNESSEGNPEDAEDTSTPVGESPKSLFEPGDRVWLYMERVKPGLTKKLAQRWLGPFRVKKKVEEYPYELELPDRSGYRFYPVVHVSRLKAVKEFGDRQKVRLTQELTDEARFDFDEELLPEDSWRPDSLAGEYEVESILDDRSPTETSTRRSVRDFLVKWVGYDEPTWETMTNLSCGGLLYDYLRERRSSQRFQMVQVADKN
ncbi:unnamed protein product [Phytophthora fragariaefolia]|uniref:Unnamed protein product n=1 Tax=Phytophthora fragariaefolia TaxID=1490495 RepID=A0A9W7D0R1_9STRA|nr:unnamed protein product [Phytophthora fragariaefolia]